MNRKEFVDTLKFVAPALATKDFIPVFTCFCFDGKKVLAYNDLISIQAPCPVNFKGAVKGTKLLGILEHSSGKGIGFSTEKEGELIVTTREKDVLPLSPTDSFVFDFPGLKGDALKINFTKEYQDAMKRCMISASHNVERAEMMGISLRIGSKIEMFSTDSTTISHCSLGDSGDLKSEKTIKLILPTGFCSTILTLPKTEKDPVLFIFPKKGFAVMVMEGDRFIFSKLIEKGDSPINFPKVIAKNFEQLDEEGGAFVDIPKKLPRVLEKAKVILEVPSKGSALITISNDCLEVSVEREGYQSSFLSQTKLSGRHGDLKVAINPFILAEASSLFDKIAFSSRSIILRNVEGNSQFLLATDNQ